MSVWTSDRSRDGGVDELSLPEGPGRLWLCGKHAVAPDPEALLERLGATIIVALNEVHELDDRYPDYVAWLRSSGKAVWHPVPDLHAPSLDEMLALVDELRRRIQTGDHLVLHCGAGIGRAGTIAAALLMRTGRSHDEALARVASSRPMAGPEAGAQRDLLIALAEHLQTSLGPTR
jgi:protein-tyrosine phosphatase